MRTSLPEPPNRFAFGSAPLTSLSVIVSWPLRPKTWIGEVFATVGVPPTTETAPPLTRIVPAALRLTAMLLSSESPLTDSTPPVNVDVTAAFAGTVVAARMPAASRPLASTFRVVRRAGLWGLTVIVLTPWRGDFDD